MEFTQYSPVVAKHLQNLIRASKAAAEAAGRRGEAERVFDEAAKSHLRAQGLTEGRQVWHVQMDGKTVKRKVTGLQILHGYPTDSSWEVVVHMDNPDNEFGALASLPNVHLRKGDYKFVPRPKVDD